MNWTNSENWNIWFQNYQQFIVHYANLSEQIGCDQFSIGGELDSTDDQTELWTETIQMIRKSYSGPITYGANHGSENGIDWWDLVDYIGVDAYYPMDPTNPSPTIDDLYDFWLPWYESLQLLSLKYDKPVIFAEVGYCSKYWSNFNPAGCDNTTMPTDYRAQENLYQALFKRFWPEDWFAGVFWWAWYTAPDGGYGQSSYSFTMKSAENVVYRYYTSPNTTYIPPQVDDLTSYDDVDDGNIGANDDDKSY